MPKDPFLYVNGMDKSLDDALNEMKDYHRRYLRDMGTCVAAEKGLLSRDDLNKYSIKDLKKSVLQRIERENLTDPSKGGRLPIMCKDGKLRYYDPDAWAETMARTRSRSLQEEGLHNEMVRAGFDLVMVSTGGSGDACTNWEGMILSISGETPGYPTVDEAQATGEIFHPRCFVDHSVSIYTSKGWKGIGHIKIGDLVLTHKGKFRKVTDLIIGSISAGEHLYRVVLEDPMMYRGIPQNIPYMTKGHPVLTKEGWKPVDKLTSTDLVCFLAKRCPGCGSLIPAWRNYCSLSCKSSYHIKKNYKKGCYGIEMRKRQSESLKKSYTDGKIDRYAITKNAQIKTRKMVKDGTHQFLKEENIFKSHSKLGKIKHASFLERKMRWLLDELGIKYVPTYQFVRDKKFRNGNPRSYFIDIAIPDKKIAIECDGYYHTRKENMTYDKQRQKEIESKGWTVIRFTDKQIRQDLKSCVAEIERILKNHNNLYEFIYLPIKGIESNYSVKGRRTYNISVEGDESYIAKFMCAHNCVHSTSPVVITEDENGPRLWGRDDLPPRAQEQLGDLGITRKGTIPDDTKTNLTEDPQPPIAMKDTNIPKSLSEARSLAEESICDHAYFSKGMDLDGVNSSVNAIQYSINRFPTGGNLSYFGLKDKAKETMGHVPAMGKDTSAMYVLYPTRTVNADMIVFRKEAVNDSFIRLSYADSAKYIQKRYGEYDYHLLETTYNVDPDVIKILKKQKVRHWALSGELGGTKGILYHEYGHRVYFKHDNNNELKSIVDKSFKKGWAIPLGKYATTNAKEYFSEAFSAFMQGFTNLLDPDLLKWLNANDEG